MNPGNITVIIVIILNIAGLCFMLIMSIPAIKNKLAGQDDNKASSNSYTDDKPMKPDLNPEDLDIDGGEDIFDDMDLMDFDELNLDDFD